jgi:hypothetical protein
VAAASLCRGSEGKAVCGDKGELTVCNPDGTIDTKSSMTCKSTRHCQAGLATNTCAVCLANEEHHCEGGALQVCAQDGRSFQKVKDCPTAALCSESAGECLMGVCSPNKVTCEANTLLTCNAAGTAYASMADCGSGTCDATGGDCNQCDPGRKTCDATAKVVLTCNADGQASAMTRCPGTQRCAGAGLCVACLGDADCGAGNKCERNQCVCAPQCAGKECGSDGCTGNCGPCTGGTTCEANRCVCVPQCSGKQCGDDGCDGNCGPCDPGLACNANGRCVKLCGNGVIDPSESCDDANSVDTDACISCQRAFCGDGRVQIGVEECDPQATGWAGRCDSNCARTVYTPCRSGSDSDCASDALCSVLANTNQGICSPMCNNKDSDCVPLPDATPGQPAFIPLCNFGRCMPQCHSGACPLHMSCVPNTPIIDAPTGAMRMADVCITAPP